MTTRSILLSCALASFGCGADTNKTPTTTDSSTETPTTDSLTTETTVTCPCAELTANAVSGWEAETGVTPASFAVCAAELGPDPTFDSVLQTRDPSDGAENYIELLARDFAKPQDGRFTCVARLILDGGVVVNSELEVPTEEEHNACRALQQTLCAPQ